MQLFATFVKNQCNFVQFFSASKTSTDYFVLILLPSFEQDKNCACGIKDYQLSVVLLLNKYRTFF